MSVTIRDGDVISVIGPSGMGKSTFLRCLNLLEKPTAGRNWLDDVEITDPKCDLGRVRRRMGMVFQSFNLFGHLTVIENIMLAPMDLLGKPKQEAYDEGMRLLRTVGLAEKALSYPDELSGGQKQRVAIARTMAMDPDVLLLDEPTSALDPTMVGEVQAVIRELARSGKTMLIVTHEMRFARAISNRVFFMADGGICEDGPPEQIFNAPQNEKTRRFVHMLKVLELKITGRDFDFLGMMGSIERYCSDSRLPPKMTQRVQLAFEELVQQQLLPTLTDPRIRIVAEYAEESESVWLTAAYSGPQLDVTQQADALSLAVLKSTENKMEYSWDPSRELPNELRLQVRPERE